MALTDVGNYMMAKSNTNPDSRAAIANTVSQSRRSRENTEILRYCAADSSG
jgi:hypothetical protein